MCLGRAALLILFRAKRVKIKVSQVCEGKRGGNTQLGQALDVRKKIKRKENITSLLF